MLQKGIGEHSGLSWDNYFISFRALNHLLLPAAFIYYQCKPGWTSDPRGKMLCITLPSQAKSGVSHMDWFPPLRLCTTNEWTLTLEWIFFFFFWLLGLALLFTILSLVRLESTNRNRSSWSCFYLAVCCINLESSSFHPLSYNKLSAWYTDVETGFVMLKSLLVWISARISWELSL